ncbi:MAG TPA: NADAR family protein [Streptosporangiaceae bacterium]|nr:NADAR family protein [Streptosporangiaceae bacterium]
MTVSSAGVRSVGELLGMVQQGGQPKYVFFWGHRPTADGGAGKGCLSQWWPAPFTVDGLVYPTAEHFMMAGKARLFGDTEMAERIRQAPHPHAAKRLGRQARGFDEQRWAQERFQVVVTGNLAKFGQHPDLREFLLATGERVLVEASPLDQVWGIGLAADDQRAATPQTWQGLNLLGFALMEVRHRLSSGPSA